MAFTNPTAAFTMAMDSAPTTTAVAIATITGSLKVTYTPGASIVRVGPSTITVVSGSGFVNIGTHTVRISNEQLIVDATPIPISPDLSQGAGLDSTNNDDDSGDGILPSAGQATGITQTPTPGTTQTPAVVSMSTSPDSTSTLAASVANSQQTKGLPSGAIAGIAIGCLVAGALLAVVLGFFMLRWRRRRVYREGYPIPSGPLGDAGERGLYMDAKPVANASEQSTILPTVTNNLPPPVEDYHLEREAQQLHQSIHAHVGTFYNYAKILQIPDEFFDFTTLGPAMAIPSVTLAALLSSLTSRQAALHFCISWTIITKLGGECGADTSLLPAELAASLQLLRSNSLAGDEARLGLYNMWRTATAGLVQMKHGRFPNAPSYNVQRAVDAIEEVLQPFVDEQQSETARRRSLEDLMEQGARLGFLLMAQPATFEFSWDNPFGEPGSLVVFPALHQVVNEDGARLHPAKGLTMPEVARGLLG